MIKSSGDLVAYAVIGIVLFAFSCMAAGYTILIRQALRSRDRKRLFKQIFNSVHDEELDPRGKRLIYLGAAIGAVVGALLLVVLIFVLRR